MYVAVLNNTTNIYIYIYTYIYTHIHIYEECARLAEARLAQNTLDKWREVI